MSRDSIKNIWDDLAKVECGPKLINQFRLHKFIPNKWFDWKVNNKLRIMIVGQDWGPYIFLKKYIDRYEIERIKEEFDYNQFLFETFSSRTEKMILQSLERSYKEKYGKEMSNDNWQEFQFSVAEFFCRSGKLFRGNANFDNRGIVWSMPFLRRQIQLMKPKVIITLGDIALKQVMTALEIPIKYRNLTQFIEEIGKDKYFYHQKTIIIPSFHPAAHVDPKMIYERLAMVWEFRS